MHKLFLIISTFSSHRATNVCNVPLRFCASSCCVVHRSICRCFLYGQPAPLVHHNAALISSSITEHRLSLSLVTYSSESGPLFEHWWTDVHSIDGLSCCIMSADEKTEAWATPCFHGFTSKLPHGSVLRKLFSNLFFIGWFISVFFIAPLWCKLIL